MRITLLHITRLTWRFCTVFAVACIFAFIFRSLCCCLVSKWRWI